MAHSWVLLLKNKAVELRKDCGVTLSRKSYSLTWMSAKPGRCNRFKDLSNGWWFSGLERAEIRWNAIFVISVILLSCSWTLSNPLNIFLLLYLPISLCKLSKIRASIKVFHTVTHQFVELRPIVVFYNHEMFLPSSTKKKRIKDAKVQEKSFSWRILAAALTMLE